jgi:hypothetical protein
LPNKNPYEPESVAGGSFDLDQVLLLPFEIFRAVSPCKWVEHNPAADRNLRRIGPNNKPIADGRNRRRFEIKLDKTFISRFENAGGIENSNTGKQLSRSNINPNALPRPERLVRHRQHLRPRVNAARCGKSGLRKQHSAAYFANLDSRQVYRYSASRSGFGDFVSQAFEPANPYRPLSRHQNNFGLRTKCAAGKCSGDNCTESLNRKSAVDWKPCKLHAVLPRRGRLFAKFGEARSKPGNTGSVSRADANDRGAFQKSTAHQLGDFQANELEHFLVCKIRFRDRDNTLPNVQQTADFKMLASLRHNSVVRSNHQKNGVDSGGSCQHIPNEALVTRNIYKRNLPIAGRHLRKSESDRYSPAFFLGQAVSIDARKSSYERRLSVVNMSGGADNDLHF